MVLSARHLHYLRLAEVKHLLRCLLSRGEVVPKAQLPTASRPWTDVEQRAIVTAYCSVRQSTEGTEVTKVLNVLEVRKGAGSTVVSARQGTEGAAGTQ